MIIISFFELPLNAMLQQISISFYLIVQANRLQGGPRKVTHITEIVGMEQDTIVMQDIYKYVQDGIDENGRAQRADLQRSSGYRKLDRAATRSAVDNWVFDVSACERKDLPVTHVVAVEYHNDTY